MQENSMDPVPLSQLLRESYLAEARAHHKHNEISPDLTSSQGLHYKSLKGKPEDSESQREPQIPDLSAFLSQEELDKSVDLARQAISHEPNMQVESQTVRPHIGSNTTPPTTEPTPEKTEVDPTHASGTNMIERQSLESPIQCNVMQNNGTLGGPHSDLKRPAKTTPYGVETQSKKEFLNKAADFIEELSSLFKANSSKRVRPRSCKAHRSRNQNKAQGSSVPFPLNEDDRERSVLQISQQINPPIIQPTSQLEELTEIQTQESRIPEEPLNPEAVEEFIPSFEAECATPELMESQCLEEPLCEPPHFIQKLKSREVPEGSKVQLDCIVHGFPLPEVRWFCEGKELENSPDIQILNNEEHHSLIISEAFEEDTGRYSCFASNFYGTDSTSAEIYVEGASSSDSEGEQHFETQKIKKVAETSATLPSVATPQPLSVEVADPVPEPVSTESTHSTSSTLVTDSVPSLLPSQEVTVLVPDKVSSVQPPAKEESPASPPPEEVTPVIPETETAAQPSNPSPQEILISLPANIQHNHIENHSSDHIITPQVLEGRPTMAAPVFTKSLQDLVAHESQLVVLECRVKGVPSPKVDWYREGTAIEDSPDFRILQKKPRSMIESEEICTLVIAEVFPEDSGTFTCTASNKYGTISSIASLKVKGTKNNHEILANQTVQQDLISSSLKRKPEPSLVNSKKLFSSMPHLDPLNCHSPLQDPFCSNALGLNSINSNTSHKDTFTTSLQNLNLSKYLTLPQLDSLGISEQDGRSLISPPHKSRNQDSLGSGFTPSHKIQIPLNGPATVDGCEPGPSSSVEQSFISQSGETAVPNAPGDAIPKTTKLNRASCNHHESLSTVPLPDPPSSCLKTRPEGGLLKHNEPRSSSRVGLRVTFKLPEDEEEERRATSWSKSMEDLHPGLVNKEPPPVLAKPKLDPKQLQILHEQVLLEQQQDVPPPNHQEFSWPQMSSREPQPPNSLESKPASTLTPVMNSSLAPKQKNTSDSSWSPLPTPQINSTAVPRTNMVPSSQPIIQQPPSSLPQVNNVPMSVASTPPLPILNMGPSVTVPQLHTSTPLSQPNQAARTPIAQLSVASLIPIHQPFIDTSIPAAKMNIAPTPQMLPLNTDPTLELNAKPNAKLNAASYVPSNQLSTMPMPQLNTYPSNHMVTTSMTQMSTTSPPQMTPSSVASVDVPVPTSLHVNFSANPSINSTPLSENSIPATQLNVAPKPLRNANSSSSSNAPDVSLLSKVPSPSLHNKPIPPVLRTVPSHLQNSNQAPLTNIALDSSINSSSGFNYTRPKEFIAAQNMSPVRSPSPTQSPVPMLLEMAAQISPRPSRVTSPLNHITQTGSAFPTRNLESPSSQVMPPPALMNSMFALRSQSPPQASSPTSSTSSPSPIQNPVAFLSSVLPSLPTSPPTNAMGLPKSAPATLPGSRRNSRSLLSISDDFRDAKETLIQDIEKKLRIKDEPTHYGQQKLTYGGKASRPLGPNIPTATVFNYDEEFKVSNFEQRLMSEIEFRLERTPVEESDEEIHHDEIPTGKCIAPIFDKKLRNYRAYEGIPVTFTCKVVGIPLPKIYWFKDGKQILSKNTHYRKLREGDGTCSLHIEVATNDDDGNYTVMAANPQGRASCSGHLIVQTGQMRNRPVISQRVRARVQEVEGEPAQERFFKPHFLQAPGDIVCHEGKLCRLDCKVNGSPPPDLMWLVNGRPIYSDFHHRLLVRENGIHSLVIDPLSQSHAGTYTCIASNKAGQSSFSLEIKVVEREIVQAPYFIEKLQNTGIAEGSPVRLECRVVGMPPPIIYWKKDNETIPHSKERMTMHQDTTGYVCLVIQPTRKDDAGWYAVSAKNEAGVISCTARLDIYAQWYQQVHPPMKKLQHTGSRYPTLLSQGLSIKSGYSSNDIYSSCREDGNHESEEL